MESFGRQCQAFDPDNFDLVADQGQLAARSWFEDGRQQGAPWQQYVPKADQELVLLSRVAPHAVAPRWRGPSFPSHFDTPAPAPLSLAVRTCQCGPSRRFGPPPCNVRACGGVLGKRGWALESVAARICREGGGRVTTNVLLRDLDLGFGRAEADGRRLEIAVDGFPLFSGAQLAVDTTLVCALRMLDFGQCDFGQFDFGQLAEVEIGRSRNWPKSNRWCLLCFFFFLFFFSLFLSFFYFFLFLLRLLSHLTLHFLFVLFLFCPKNMNPEPRTLNPKPSAGQPSAGQPSAGPPKISLFFTAPIFVLLSLSWGSFR